MKITDSDCTGIVEMWETILKYSETDVMTEEILKKGMAANMTREQTLVALAYYALRKAEALLNKEVERLMMKRMPNTLLH